MDCRKIHCKVNFFGPVPEVIKHAYYCNIFLKICNVPPAIIRENIKKVQKGWLFRFQSASCVSQFLVQVMVPASFTGVCRQSRSLSCSTYTIFIDYHLLLLYISELFLIVQKIWTMSSKWGTTFPSSANLSNTNVSTVEMPWSKDAVIKFAPSECTFTWAFLISRIMQTLQKERHPLVLPCARFESSL